MIAPELPPLGVPGSLSKLRFSFLCARSACSASTFVFVSTNSLSTSGLLAWTMASKTCKPKSFFAAVILFSSMVMSAVILARCAARFDASPAAKRPVFILSKALILPETACSKRERRRCRGTRHFGIHATDRRRRASWHTHSCSLFDVYSD